MCNVRQTIKIQFRKLYNIFIEFNNIPICCLILNVKAVVHFTQ